MIFLDKIKILKKRWYLVLLAFLASVLFFLKAIIKITLFKSPPPEPYQKNLLEDIVRKSFSLEDIENNLGQPIKTEIENNQKVFYYHSHLENWPIKVYVSQKDQKVTLIKEFFPQNKSYQDFLAKLGPPEKELFGPFSQIGFSVFVFPKKGIALVANTQENLVFEIWYFSPTTIENFVKKYEKDLNESPLKINIF